MLKKPTTFDVIIIGAGAAGLMCAAHVAKRGHRVLVLEKANKAGKKILMSGGGKCNFTNLDIQPEHYLCHNPHFVISALSRYTQWDFIQLVNEYQIDYLEKEYGKLFTTTGAKDILAMLLDLCQQSQVDIRCQHEVLHADYQTNQFYVNTSQGHFSCQSLVVASGGLSIPTLGGSGIAYDLAQHFGHHVYPTRAGLVPFTFTDSFKNSCQRLTGIALPVSLHHANTAFQEPLLFTHRGLSGPVSLQLSNYWQHGEIVIDFLPQIDTETILIQQKQRLPKHILRTILHDYLPKQVLLELQTLIWQAESEQPMADFSHARLADISYQLSHFVVKPSGTEGYRTAEVTLGGVDTDELSSKTMQSKKQQGLYFIGEAVDVTGHLGGYNFQWAWSSAMAAARSI